jgi:hypothetical protein
MDYSISKVNVMRLGASSLPYISRNRYILLVVLSVVVLTCANVLFCAISYELGFGHATFVGTGPDGPTDRFADLVKVSFSYKSFTTGIDASTFDTTIESWPDVFASYYMKPVYGGKTALDSGKLTTYRR